MTIEGAEEVETQGSREVGIQLSVSREPSSSACRGDSLRGVAPPVGSKQTRLGWTTCATTTCQEKLPCFSKQAAAFAPDTASPDSITKPSFK